MAQDPGPLDALYETDVQTPGARPEPGHPAWPRPPAATPDPAAAPGGTGGTGRPGAFSVPVLPGAHFLAVVSSAVLR